MPRSFLLKRNNETMVAVKSGSKMGQNRVIACYREHELKEYSDEERFVKIRNVKMIPKPLKAFRVNPYDNDVGCKLYDIDDDRYKLYDGNTRERDSNARHKWIERKKSFSVGNLMGEKKMENGRNNQDGDHPHLHKKSTVSIMNIKNSPKVVERYKTRSPIDDSRLNYKSALWVDAERHRISDSPYVPSPYLTSPTHSYRSSETGSANSTGSCCNSYPAPRGNMSGLSSPDEYSKYAICTQPCCRSSYEGSDKYVLREHSHPYPSHERDKRRKINEPSCACAQCDVNREFLRRGSKYVDPGVNENYIMSKQRKRLSKRKALLNELELENKRNESVRSITPVPREMSRETYDDRTVLKRKPTTTDVLEIPAGPNRSRAVANLLERRRVAELNSSFETLRVLVPTYGNEDRSLSKIKTLKYALTYIEHLMTVLTEFNSNTDFDVDKDIVRLCRKDPLIQKSRDHMKNNRKLF